LIILLSDSYSCMIVRKLY